MDSSAPDATPVSSPVTDGDWRTDTAERRGAALTTGAPGRSGDARTPPAAVAPPPPPRYPLYADEVEGLTRTSTPADTEAGAATTSVETAHDGVVAGEHTGDHEGDFEGDYDDYYDYYDEEERRSPLLWILVTLVVLALLGAGWWFFVRDDDTTAKDASTGTGSSQSTDNGIEVAGRASARAPQTASPNQDVNGDQVSYDASNMLDGVPDTTWRVPGNATGMELTFTLREPTELHQVGLINGYAKTSTDDQGATFDWYAGNRRVNAVVWQFDDGTKYRQQLEEDRGLQMMEVSPVETSRVVLRLVRVSKPGEGAASRDFTAVSEVSLVGVPQP